VAGHGVAKMGVADEIFGMFERRGATAYFGEGVSTTQHALQTAHFVSQAGAQPALVLAGLLHDIGHLLEDVPEHIADWHGDLRHEQVGAAWLAQRLPPSVSEPVRLHVRAKRYLCATDLGYRDSLSEASLRTLQLQGGPLSSRAAAEFEAEPFHRDALLLRRSDDHGKVVGLEVPALDAYRGLIESMSRPA